MFSLAQCLYVLTEENSTAVNEIRMDSGSVNSLLGIAKGDAKTSTKSTSKNFEGTQRALSVRLMSLRTLACGRLLITPSTQQDIYDFIIQES
jgi:hypothetical protein